MNAEYNFNKSLQLNSLFFQAYIGLGQISKIKKKFFEAINFFNKAISINQDFADTYFNFG